jgi:hypothetical protein
LALWPQGLPVGPTDRRRRVFGLVCLGLSLVLVAVGFSDFGGRLTGLKFLLYWLACAGLAVLALLTAVLDLLIVNARGRAERRELARRTAAEIEAALQRSDATPQNGSQES